MGPGAAVDDSGMYITVYEVMGFFLTSYFSRALWFWFYFVLFLVLIAFY